jgi:hypothetical protein
VLSGAGQVQGVGAGDWICLSAKQVKKLAMWDYLRVKGNGARSMVAWERHRQRALSMVCV